MVKNVKIIEVSKILKLLKDFCAWHLMQMDLQAKP